jgi:PadR family transcriptional regulator PadR
MPIKTPRMSSQTLQVLESFMESPRSWRYGYDLSRETELKAGTLYPILMRLTGYELLEAQWMTAEEGTPPRHMYRLTPKGVQVAREKLGETSARVPLRQPATSRGKA